VAASASGRIRTRLSRHAVMVSLALLAMGAMAINHRSNAAWLMVSLTVSAALASLAHGRANLRAVAFTAAAAAPVAAGEPVVVTVRAHNRTGRDAHGLRVAPLGGGEGLAVLPLVVSGGDGEASLVLPALARGIHPLPALEVSSAYPLGLARLCRELHPEGEVVVHPRPAGRPLAAASDGASGCRERPDRDGHEDFRGHRRHRSADSPRRIDWRASERVGQLLVKEWSGSDGGATWLAWEQCAGGVEARLSQLARWVVEADASGAPYGLRLPGAEVQPATGAAHRHACLRVLARHPPEGLVP
jgi:uncharacterized protein (DUF58 family)